MFGRSPAEGYVADSGDLSEAEGWVLRLAIDDEPSHCRREPLVFDWFRAEEARHAVFVEVVCVATEGSLRNYPGFAGAFGDRATEDHDRPEQFVFSPLRPSQQEFELVPLFGGFDPFSTPHDHVSPSLQKATPIVLPLLLRRSSSPSERRDDTLRIRRMPRMRIRRQLQHENSEEIFGHWYCTHNQRIY